MRRMSSVWAAAVAVAMVALPTARANLIQNGDFGLYVPNYGYGNYWTAWYNDGNGGWRSGGGNPSEFFILNDGGSWATDPIIYQTVTGLTPGEVYRVEGDFRTVWVGYDTGGINGFGVAIDATWMFEHAGRAYGWTHFSFDFIASGASATVLLAAERNRTDTDFGIDNLIMERIRVPDATGAAWLFGLAWAVLLGLRRRLR